MSLCCIILFPHIIVQRACGPVRPMVMNKHKSQHDIVQWVLLQLSNEISFITSIVCSMQFIYIYILILTVGWKHTKFGFLSLHFIRINISNIFSTGDAFCSAKHYGNFTFRIMATQCVNNTMALWSCKDQFDISISYINRWNFSSRDVYFY